MKKFIIGLLCGITIGIGIGLYLLYADDNYDRGVRDGYDLQKAHAIFSATVNYQRGWEDCYEVFKKKNKRTNLTRR